MPKLSKYIAISMFLILASYASAGNWTIYKRAEIRSKEKNIFRIDVVSKDNVRAWLILRHATEGVFESKLPLYQVDKNNVRDLSDAINRHIKKNRWIIWQISNSSAQPSSELLEIMEGRQVIFQYYLPNGTIKETVFNLEGARKTIEEILK